MEKLDKNRDTQRRNCAQNQTERKVWSPTRPAEGGRSCLLAPQMLVGQHPAGMTIGMRWNGQGTGNLPVKPAVGVNVTRVIGLPEKTKGGRLARGQQRGSGVCSRGAVRDRTQGQGRKPGSGVAGRAWQHLLALRRHGKHLGGAKWASQ